MNQRPDATAPACPDEPSGARDADAVAQRFDLGQDQRIPAATESNASADVPGEEGDIEVGPGTENDLPGIVEILNHAIATSDAVFVTTPITVAELREWFGRFAATGPYRLFVARCGGRVVGYACSQRYRDLEAFRETVEVSIALSAGYRGRGLGGRLYGALFENLAGAPVHTVLAGIAMPNDASVALHRRFGFVEIGTFREYAIKNGRYLSSLWMQRLPQPAG